MVSNSTQPFRFMDLPGELRNQVYTLLLCSFGSPVEQTWENYPLPIESAGHCADTAILLTSRQVHLEAYDVMVKANRFVFVRAFPPLPLMEVLQVGDVTVITLNDLHISQFKGHMLAVTLSTSTPSHEPPMSVMLLARDMEPFCANINRIGFDTTLIIDVDVAPLLGEPTPVHKDAFDAFVSEEIQLSLLSPFKTCMRGFKNVHVHGRVSSEIATATAADMCKDEWLESVETLHQIQGLKDHADVKWDHGSRKEASGLWDECLMEIGRMRASSSWGNLVLLGGDSFVDAMIELRFSCCLSLFYAIIAMFNDEMENGKTERLLDTLDMILRRTMTAVEECMEPNLWQEGREWEPSDARFAKLIYRQAIMILLGGNIRNAGLALDLIRGALELSPHDRDIMKAHDAMIRWRASGCNFDADGDSIRIHLSENGDITIDM
ncbi:uncharacterized protein J4E88_002598 [Alternaria novae-zelandiae]|uniref:uncharacterized protein n=1 Tax=Alternaria novae-zelandiae TaxID=430562 RepID=UPI0020C2DCF9|nr:uncharacterized protein J4E88_002598 [Alternaria novae-zelandiae]KAI4689248.1 hypothetical protein J4E88_002598 [Alternaria novae-zelandiae]